MRILLAVLQHNLDFCSCFCFNFQRKILVEVDMKRACLDVYAVVYNESKYLRYLVALVIFNAIFEGKKSIFMFR